MSTELSMALKALCGLVICCHSSVLMTGIKVSLWDLGIIPSWLHSQNLGWFLPCTPVIRSSVGSLYGIPTFRIRSSRRRSAWSFLVQQSIVWMLRSSSVSSWLLRAVFDTVTVFFCCRSDGASSSSCRLLRFQRNLLNRCAD